MRVTTPVSPLTEALAKRLRGVAAELRVQQLELAARSGVTQSTISRIFAEKKTMTTDELYALCSALGLDPVEVWESARAAAGEGRAVALTTTSTAKASLDTPRRATDRHTPPSREK